jgi:integrase
MGSVYKRRGSKKYMMAVIVGGRQICRSTHTSNKRLADQLLAGWQAEVFEGRFHLLRSRSPLFEDYAKEFESSVPHQKTRSRYETSNRSLLQKFKGVRVSEISAALIEEYIQLRLAAGIGPATINRDLAVLRRMLKLAQRKRFIIHNPFVEIELLEERKQRRRPHIVSYEEEQKLLATASPQIRAVATFMLETGARPISECLQLRWDDVDFENEFLQIRESKTAAGIRRVPLSLRCKTELLRWREHVGVGFSEYVFPNMYSPDRPLKDIRRSWAKALNDAKLAPFWMYNLRHTFASRLSAAGVPDVFVAQLMGHSTPSILHTYAKIIDEYRRDAIRRLDNLRTVQSQIPDIARPDRRPSVN